MSDDIRFPTWWVGVYSRGLPESVRAARVREIASDVHEQLSTAPGPAVRGVRAAVVGRTVRGMVDDLAWRIEQRRVMNTAAGSTGFRTAWTTATQSWFAPLAVLLGLGNVVLAVGVLADGNSTMPGRVVGPAFLTGCAIAMFTGLRLRLRTRTGHVGAGARGPRATMQSRILIVVMVVSAISTIVGVLTPAAFVTGVILLVASSVGLARSSRTVAAPGSGALRRESVVLADTLIVLGCLPGLALFWFIVPAVLALAVIAGVLGTGPALKRSVPA